ncbi:uncharacterized protein LOC126592133 [Malus sylvestris]|uniref:uncharacterized protein LOC126592133 n=1 Tax=Malus sylvestris TaxID=3752 RepID=UPI0021ACC8F2|nr:uncharacterized protein LOC126592133 [Malus sylvestris]
MLSPCMTVQRVNVAKKCILEHFGAFLGREWMAYAWSKRNGRNLKWFMIRSSQPIHKHIRDFDDDFERTLRRARNQQEPQPFQPAPDLGEDKVEEQEEPMAQVVEEDPNMAALGKTYEFELKSSLLHHIPKFHGMSMEDPNKHLKEFKSSGDVLDSDVLGEDPEAFWTFCVMF